MIWDMKVRLGRKKVSFKPIIIGGFYRSGTSLLRRILDSHSNIFCPPEIKFFKDFYGDYLNDPLGHVRFFSTLRSMGLSEKKLLLIYGQTLIKVYEEAARLKGKKRWADKNPENLIFLEEWERVLNKRFLFIFMVRNPLDTLSSLQEVGFEKAVPREMEGKVDLYLTFINKGLDFIKKNPSKSMIVRYEDLVQKPRQEIEIIVNFLGEEFENQMLTDYSKPARGKGIEDPKVRYTFSIDSSSVNRWKSDLNSEQELMIREKCREVNKCLGYLL